MHASNPFATRFVRPGAIRYLFPEGQTEEGLVEKLRTNGWWGEIVGPHGTGKSTLLASLIPALELAGRNIVRFMLSEGERKLPLANAESTDWNGSTQLVIDGYEQLSWWSRSRIKSLCRKRGAGLLVTAHQPMGLPLLATTEPSVELARRVVAQLLAGDKTLSDEDVAKAFAQQQGNVRETLFALYDLYHARRGVDESQAAKETSGSAAEDKVQN